MTEASEASRRLLRHTVATLAYRGGKTVRDAPPAFAAFRAGETTRTPAQILAHVGDLLDWGLAMAKGEPKWSDSTPLPWEEETARFFEGLKRLDDFVASDAPLAVPVERLFQGPVADALAHVGQIALLRRMSGAPVRGENYFMADIEAGRVGPKQSAARKEFD
ncbi:MAG TPA: hypothetical protein VLH41_09785 [Thermoanaerobaculia bacterium]|nr:hypothetical protein [Thermoanaerobaculia bacterium]